MARLVAVDSQGIEQIAFDLIDESGRPRTDGGQKELEPEQIWGLIGGMQGLEVLERNSLVLIDMAYYVQRWYPEAIAVAEELRIKAREIEWHVSRLRAAERTGKLEAWFANYAQNATAAYYLMTRRILVLYKNGDVAMAADLQRAL